MRGWMGKAACGPRSRRRRGRRAALAKAYPKAAKNRKNYEDDLEAMLAARIEPRLVPTAAISLRIRSADDLAPVLALMK
jgi:2-C-methyl-D-erythritol 4-phosphate cytidylyltransferase